MKGLVQFAKFKLNKGQLASKSCFRYLFNIYALQEIIILIL